jgi:hypothetical protein
MVEFHFGGVGDKRGTSTGTGLPLHREARDDSTQSVLLFNMSELFEERQLVVYYVQVCLSFFTIDPFNWVVLSSLPQKQPMRLHSLEMLAKSREQILSSSLSSHSRFQQLWLPATMI